MYLAADRYSNDFIDGTLHRDKGYDSKCLYLPGKVDGVGKTLLYNYKGRGFESHLSNMPVICFEGTRIQC